MTAPLRLIVTGMHRSGTSFVASLFASWNVRMGERLLPGDRNNPAGYFEDADFLTLNQRILLACTPSEEGHRDWGWTESERFDDTRAASYRDAAAALVAARNSSGEPWGWKDPRTSMLLDFWDDVLEHDGRFLLLYRQPWDVADSMQRTGKDLWLTHPGYAARIWTRYNRRILEFHRRNRDRTLLVSTNRLLRDPEAFAAAVRRQFGVGASADTIATLKAEGAFFSLPDDDPLPRLWQFTNPEAMALLGALDDAADLGNDRTWEAASRRRAPIPATPARLSVVIPCYDDGDYLIEAVASVERNAPAAELIIVDDGSTEPRTRDVLGALREAGHRVLEQPHEGLSAARNTAIAAAAGDYLLPLDADNRLLPGFAAEAVALLDAHPDAGVVYGDRREFGARTGEVVVPEFDLPQLLWSNTIDACAVLRRTVWSEAGGYDVALHMWEDWDFWLGAASRGWRFVRIPRPTFEYRVRPDSIQQQFLRRTDYPPALRGIYAKHRDLVSKHAAEILIAGHIERHQLLGHVETLRAARDTIQVEIDRLARGTKEELRARDTEIASIKQVLAARDEELAALRSPRILSTASPEPALTERTRVFTIIAKNYLAHARVLAASLARHNPSVRLHVVVLDDPRRSIQSEEAFETIHADELPFDPPSDLYTMAATYDVTELATAVKPWAFEWLFARGATVVIYLDPDIEVFDSLGPLESLTLEHGMLLTPHVTEPLPRDGKHPDDRDLLLAGIYNLGFLGLSASAAATFLPWWRERLRRDCLNEPSQGWFVDQRWIDFAPALFQPGILRDPGYNVAYWNLPQRALQRDGDRIVVHGRPLRFLHYSGFTPRAPHLLSKHQHASLRIRLSQAPLLAELCERYAASLEAAGFNDCSALPYGFTTLAGGLPLDTRTRRVLRRTYLEDEAAGGAIAFPNPFSESAAEDVIQRLLRPAPYAPGVSGYLAEIWREREDLHVAFPRIDSVDAERFLDWVRVHGVREHDIPAPLIPPAVSEDGESNAVLRSEGVNVYGYAFAESGTGQIVRSVVAALAAEGIPYAVVPFTRTISRQREAFRDTPTTVPAFDTNLICVNADQVPLFFESMRAQLPAGARNIGLWAWEVEDLPPEMAQSERYFDEVWGISSFTAAALARSLSKPVRAFPLPVGAPEIRRRTRAELGMPEGFLFLFCFDYDSVFRRKNPLAVVAAFRQAFADRDDVVLYIKTTNAERHGAEDEELRAAAVGASNIVIRDAYVTKDEYFSMLDACDCYVSLHRSEGFGLTVAEAMALGKPVISTAYSATLEFANDANSFPVPARLVEVGAGVPPYPPHARWAEPDIAAAAERMTRVYKDRHAAATIGERARGDIETLHSPSARGRLLRSLLESNRPTAMTIEPTPPPPPLPPPPPPVEERSLFDEEASSVEALLGSPRADLPSPRRGLVAPLRRLVLRCIRVYWVQQLAINRALFGLVRALRGELRADRDRIEEETRRLREELTELRQRIDERG